MELAAITLGAEGTTGTFETVKASHADVAAFVSTESDGRKENAVVTNQQLEDILNGLTAILADDGSYVEVLFGNLNAFGRLNRLGGAVGILDITKTGSWSDGASTVITESQARELIALRK